MAQRQEVWNKFMELERRSKDPSRLAARGYSMLKEEKERNKVNKALPRLEEELHELITQWEQQHGKQFQVIFVLKLGLTPQLTVSRSVV